MKKNIMMSILKSQSKEKGTHMKLTSNTYVISVETFAEKLRF